jgi:hypothetical protein
MMCLLNLFWIYIRRDHSGQKRDPANMGGIHPFPLPVPFPYFSVNTETGGINIEIRTGRDFFHTFSFLVMRCQRGHGRGRG